MILWTKHSLQCKSYRYIRTVFCFFNGTHWCAIISPGVKTIWFSDKYQIHNWLMKKATFCDFIRVTYFLQHKVIVFTLLHCNSNKYPALPLEFQKFKFLLSFLFYVNHHRFPQKRLPIWCAVWPAIQFLTSHFLLKKELY